jgi:hypothetical protein
MFQAVPDMLVLFNNGVYKTGVSFAHLSHSVFGFDNIAIIRCNYDEAVSLSKIAPKLNTSSVCVFLHARTSELLCRLHERNKKKHITPDECYEIVQEIYEDHNRYFVTLEENSLANSGFTAVLPVNTGATKKDTYVNLIVQPILSMFESLTVYKNMRKMRNNPQVGVLRYAN